MAKLHEFVIRVEIKSYFRRHINHWHRFVEQFYIYWIWKSTISNSMKEKINCITQQQYESWSSFSCLKWIKWKLSCNIIFSGFIQSSRYTYLTQLTENSSFIKNNTCFFLLLVWLKINMRQRVWIRPGQRFFYFEFTGRRGKLALLYIVHMGMETRKN